MITPRRCLPVLLPQRRRRCLHGPCPGRRDPFYGAIVEPASCSPKTRPGSLQVSVECGAEQAPRASMRKRPCAAPGTQVRVDPLPAREGAQGKTKHYVVTLSYL